MKRKHTKMISWIIILFFTWLTFTINISFPQRAFAEGLAISGLQCKTTEFKPYLEKGQFAYFLNQPASVTAEIQDNVFNLVRKIQFMKMEEAGENIIMWDGKDEKGNFIKDGEYFLSVSAMGGQGLAVASSIEMKIAFDAPMGTEFKGHWSRLEGREKKEYPGEVPKKMRVESCLAPVGCCLGGLGLIALAINLNEKMGDKNENEGEKYDKANTEGGVVVLSLLGGLYLTNAAVAFLSTATNDIINKNTARIDHIIYYEDDYAELADMKRAVDKYNAKIDAAIAKQNRKIDAYNQKIKDSARIRILAYRLKK